MEEDHDKHRELDVSIPMAHSWSLQPLVRCDDTLVRLDWPAEDRKVQVWENVGRWRTGGERVVACDDDEVDEDGQDRTTRREEDEDGDSDDYAHHQGVVNRH